MKIMSLVALVAAYAAVSPSEVQGIAALHRKREELLKDSDLSAEEKQHIGSVLRLVEIAPATADAKSTATTTAPFLEPDGGYSEKRPNGPEPTPEPESAQPADEGEGGSQDLSQTFDSANPPKTEPVQ